MKALFLALALLLAPRSALAWTHGNSSLVPIAACPFDGNGIDDGCDALAAAGQIGLYTANTQNSTDTAAGCNLVPNCFFTYAAQTTGGLPQTYTSGIPGTSATHPINFNQPGGDYGIGPYTANANLINARTYGSWPAIPGASCAYTAASHYVRCAFAVPAYITGYIASGVLHVSTVVSGTVSQGQYVYYAAPVATGGSTVDVAPYNLLSGSGGTFTLAGNPPNVGSSGSPQPLNVATQVNIAGFNFDDVYLFFTGTGVFNVQNNRFTIGPTLCRAIPGTGMINAGPMLVSTGSVLSNYGGIDTGCSTTAFLYPTIGATTASFTGSTSSSTLTVNTPTTVFTGAINNGTVGSTGVILTVSGVASGTLVPGQGLYGAGISVTTTLGNQLTGTPGSTGTYMVNTSQLVAPGATFSVGPAIGSYVTGTGFTSPVAPQVLSNSGGGVYTLSNPEPTLGPITITAGPVQTNSGPWTTYNMGGGYLTIKYNYWDKVYTQAVTSGLQNTIMKYNFSEVINPPASHYEQLSQEPSNIYNNFNGTITGTSLVVNSGTGPAVGDAITGTNVTAGTTVLSTGPYVLSQSSTTAAESMSRQAAPGSSWTIATHIQDTNTVLIDNTSSSGCAYGGTTTGCSHAGIVGTLVEGGVTGNGTFFAISNTSNANTAYAYQIVWAYIEFNNNIFITNASTANYNGTKAQIGDAELYFDTQPGSGPYPGTITASAVNNNYFDPTGLAACYNAGSIPGFTPTLGTNMAGTSTGINIDLLNGSTADLTHCYGANQWPTGPF